MAITVHGSSSWTDGAGTEDPYTSGSFTPPAAARVFVCASAFASSGDTSSRMVVNGTVLTWTQVPGAFLDKFTHGGSVAPPPIGFYEATGTGVPITVTQECVDGVGFSHVQGIWVLPGSGNIIDVGTFSGLGAASISLDATAAGQIALFGMVDWSNNSNTPVKSNGSMTTRKSGASGDVQAHLLGDLFSSGAGTIVVGTNVLGSPQGTNAVAILVDLAASAPVYPVSASWSAESAMTAAAVTVAYAGATLSAESSMTAAAVTTAHASASFSAETSMTAAAVTTAVAAATMSGQSAMTVSAVTTAYASASWSAQSSMTITPAGVREYPGIATPGDTSPGITPGGTSPGIIPSGLP